VLRSRPTPLLRAGLALAATSCALTLAACGGAGYGEPVAGGDGAAPVAGATVPQDGATGGSTDGQTRTTTRTSSSRSTSTTTRSTPSAGGGDGGGDGGSTGRTGGGPTIASYSSAVNGFCQQFTSAGQAYNQAFQELASGGDTSSAGARKLLGQATVAFSDGLKGAASTLRKGTPPASQRGFHTRTLSALDSITSAIGGSRSQLLAGDTAALGRVATKVQASGAAGVKVPAAIASLAPACKAFAG
jgi:hypothetical protein